MPDPGVVDMVWCPICLVGSPKYEWRPGDRNGDAIISCPDCHVAFSLFEPKAFAALLLESAEMMRAR